MARVSKVASRIRHLALLGLVLSAGMVFAVPRRIARDLKQQSSGQWVNVIVQYRVSPTQTHFARVVAKGGAMRQNLSAIRAGAFTVKANALAALAKDPDVVYISPDRAVHATATV